MVAIDIALAFGSTEAIVESLYSVMQSQAMPGGQDNSTSALRFQCKSCNCSTKYILKYFIIIIYA
jgi:hypothetical protein